MPHVHVLGGGAARRSPAQKIAKSAIGFLAGGGQIPRPLFETIVDQNLGGHCPLSPLKIFFLVSSSPASCVLQNSLSTDAGRRTGPFQGYQLKKTPLLPQLHRPPSVEAILNESLIADLTLEIEILINL